MLLVLSCNVKISLVTDVLDSEMTILLLLLVFLFSDASSDFSGSLGGFEDFLGRPRERDLDFVFSSALVVFLFLEDDLDLEREPFLDLEVDLFFSSCTINKTLIDSQ